MIASALAIFQFELRGRRDGARYKLKEESPLCGLRFLGGAELFLVFICPVVSPRPLKTCIIVSEGGRQGAPPRTLFGLAIANGVPGGQPKHDGARPRGILSSERRQGQGQGRRCTQAATTAAPPAGPGAALALTPAAAAAPAPRLTPTHALALALTLPVTPSPTLALALTLTLNVTLTLALTLPLVLALVLALTRRSWLGGLTSIARCDGRDTCSLRWRPRRRTASPTPLGRTRRTG